MPTGRHENDIISCFAEGNVRMSSKHDAVNNHRIIFP